MELTFILSDCPMTGKPADFRRCRLCPVCDSLAETGRVDCGHPDATDEKHPERMEAIRSSVGVQHIGLVS
jgi:hypothetical protein